MNPGLKTINPKKGDGHEKSRNFVLDFDSWSLWATGAFAAEKDAIKKQVDDIVVAIDGGKMAEDFVSAAQNKSYYVFIMEEGGMLLVHPSLVGQSLKEKAEPVYAECAKTTAEGVWVSYEWKGKVKNTYVRKTKSGLIVGSGY